MSRMFSHMCFTNPIRMIRIFRVASMFRELQMNPDAWKRQPSDAKAHVANCYGTYHKPQLRDVLATTADILRTPYSKRQPLICSSMTDESYLLRRIDAGYLGEDLIAFWTSMEQESTGRHVAP